MPRIPILSEFQMTTIEDKDGIRGKTILRISKFHNSRALRSSSQIVIMGSSISKKFVSGLTILKHLFYNKSSQPFG